VAELDQARRVVGAPWAQPYEAPVHQAERPSTSLSIAAWPRRTHAGLGPASGVRAWVIYGTWIPMSLV